MRFLSCSLAFILIFFLEILCTGRSFASPKSTAIIFYSFKAAYSAGNKALKKARFEEAAQDYDAAEALASSAQGRCDAYNAEGWALVKAKKWPEAKKIFAQAVAEVPDSSLALKNLGYVCFNLYEYGYSGVDELKNAIQYLGASGEDEELLDWAKGDLSREESYLQSTPEITPDLKGQSFKTLLAMGDEAQANGQYNLALKIFKRAALDAYSVSLKALAANRLGKVLLDDRKSMMAVTYFQTAVKERPGQKVYWNNLAYSYWVAYDSGRGTQADLKKAVAAYYHVNTLDPTFNNEMFQMVLQELQEVDPADASQYTVVGNSSQNHKSPEAQGVTDDAQP